MSAYVSVRLILIPISVVVHFLPVYNCFLLYPAATVFQITTSVSAPIELPGRKIYLDWGLQQQYDMPYNVSQFTSVAIWPYSRKYARDLDFVNKTTDLRVNGGEYGEDSSGRKIHSKDFTAGELYRSFEDLLVSYDFHETCLLRSVCELARHPFAEEQQNILTEVLTFFLTPSLHESFAKNEDLYREVYEEAEQRGFLGENCSEIYNECKQDLISAVTKIVT